MQPRIRMGLFIGVVGLVLNICVSGFIGLCGPVVSLLAGGIAGFLAAQQERLPTKSEGAKAGAIAGLIAGGLVIVGQIIGGIGALAFMQLSGTPSIFGEIPNLEADPSGSIIYYASGIGTGLCFGIVGTILAALTGAGVGYMTTTEDPTAPIIQ